MPGTQALDLSRTVAFSAAAHELTLIVDKDDRLYDHRVFEPLSDEFILSVANHGVLQSIRCQARGKDNVVIIGKQRTKACLVIDHLVGARAYKGTLAPVLEAVQRLKVSDLGKRIVDLVGAKGVRLTVLVVPPSAGAAGAQRVMGVENAHRRGDTDAELARKAQRMETLGVPRQEIASDLGLTLNKLGRLLKVDPDAAPAPKKKREPGPKRPGAKRLAAARAVYAEEEESVPALLLGWVLGEVPAARVVAVLPALDGVLG